MKKILCILSLILFLLPATSFADKPTKQTVVFAQRGKQNLLMDIYSSNTASKELKPAVIFIFGGGFYEGNRDADKQKNLINHLAKRGFVVAAIDYRLGLKGKKGPTMQDSKPLATAISMAVEDLFSATEYSTDHAEELNIDSNKIILIGSSAGAVTALQANYILSNARTDILPNSFNYAGVIGFSGAVYSTQGIPKYQTAPAPTLLFHGTEDKTVPYDKIEFGDGAMFGGKSLAKLFRENNYPYTFYSMEGLSHSVSVYSMSKYLPEIDLFINEFIFNGKNRLIDIHLKDNNEKFDPRFD